MDSPTETVDSEPDTVETVEDTETVETVETPDTPPDTVETPDTPPDTVETPDTTVDTPVDTPDTPIDTPDTPVAPTFLDMTTVEPGDLVISEFLPEPADCNRARSQYIEIYNATALPIRINGLKVRAGAGTYIVSSTYELAPGDWAVGTRSSAQRCPYPNLTSDFTYNAALEFSNSDTLSILNTANVVLDTVAYSGWDTTTGHALHLERNHQTSSENDVEANWCFAVSPLGGAGTSDFGSPGRAEDGCFVPDTALPSETGDTTDTTDTTDSVDTLDTPDTTVDTTDTTDTTVDTTDTTDTRSSDGDLDGNELLPGELYLSEVMMSGTDAAAGRTDYLEVYNASAWPINLVGLTINIGGTSGTVEANGAASTIAPGGYGIVFRRANTFSYTQVTPQYRFPYGRDFTATTYELLSSGVSLDIVDMSGWLIPEGASVQLNPIVDWTSPDANDAESDWCAAADLIPGSIGDRGTPNQPNVCFVVDTDRDITDGISADELVSGELMIVEVLVDPRATQDVRGQYIEVINTTASVIQADGLEFLYNGVSNTVTALGDGNIAPGARAVFKRDSVSAFYFAFVPDFSWAPSAIGAGHFQLVNARGLVDDVDMTGWPIPSGYAWQLDPTVTLSDETSNDALERWCAPADASLISPSATDRGTPGYANACAGGVDTVDTEPVDTDVPVDTSVDPVRNPNDGIQSWELLPGELIMTELFLDPNDAGCSNSESQYLEVYNSTAYPVEPNGILVDRGTSVDKPATLRANSDGVIPPYSYGVIAVKNAAGHCYGTDWWDLEVSAVASFGANLIRIHNAVEIDAVDFTGITVPSGASLSLEAGREDDGNPFANDSQARWCVAGEVIPGAVGDKGSPGSRNVCEGQTSDTDTGDTDVDPSVVRDASFFGPGELVITEVLESSRCDRSKAEFIEIYNTRPEPMNLGGIRIVYQSDRVTVPVTWTLPDAVIPANGLSVISRPVAAECLASTATFSRWDLDPNGNRIEIYNDLYPGGTLLIDFIDTRGWLDADGASLQQNGYSIQLDSRKFDAIENNAASAWCLTLGRPETEHGSGSGVDYTSAGEFNAACLDLCDTAAGETDCAQLLDDTFAVADTDTDTGRAEPPPPPDSATLQPGDLIITEIMPHPVGCALESSGEWFEFYNNSGRDLNLRDLVIEDKDGNTSILLDTLIPAGGYAVGGNARDTFARCYPIGEAFTYGSNYSLMFSNSGDKLVLRAEKGGTIIDQVDFRGFDLIAGSSLQLRPELPMAVAANDVAEAWCEPEDTATLGRGNLGTPGAPNVCRVVTPIVVDTVDTVVNALEVQPGDLVITEMLVQTTETGCDDTNAEYIELYNRSGRIVDLYGLTLQNRFTSATFTFTTHVEVDPGGLAIGARPAPRCFTFTPDFTYSSILFSNGGDLLRVKAGATIIDEVDFRRWRPVPGRSLSLDPLHIDPALNNSQLYWCNARTLIPGALYDFGTPGRRNNDCPQFSIDEPVIDTPDTDTDTTVDTILDTDTTVDTTDTTDTDVFEIDTPYVPTGPGTPVSSLSAGALVITELMLDPRFCTVASGQYIELRNTTASEVNLNGLRIRIGADTFTVGSPVVVGAGREAVAQITGPDACYPFTPQASFGAVIDGGEVVSLASATTTLDSVNTAIFPAGFVGLSWSLDGASLNATANDAIDNWCFSTVFIAGTSIKGTPGGANPACTSIVEPPETGPVVDSSDTFPDTFASGDAVDQLNVGDIIITEFMVDPRDCDDRAAEYVEIYNRTDALINLDGFVISNGSVTSSVTRPDGRTWIDPHETVVLQRYNARPCYAFGGRLTYDSLLLGGAYNTLYIANGTKILDLVHFSSWPTEAGRAWTLDRAKYDEAIPAGPTDAPGPGPFQRTYVHDNVGDWCAAWLRFDGAAGDRGSPGDENTTCPLPGEPLPYPPDYELTVDELLPGDLILSEVMASPTACSVYSGQWFEIFNNAGLPISLNGLRIASLGGNRTISTTFVVQPGEYAIARRTAQQGCYPNLRADIVYPPLLEAGGDFITLSSANFTIDSVDFRGWTVPVGASLSLSGDMVDAASNDLSESWCAAVGNFPGSASDLGSPEQANPVCVDTLADSVAGTTLSPGDLVITEYLLGNADCTSDEQYIEVYNTLDEAVDVFGLRLRTEFTWTTFNDHGVIPPHGYGLLAKSATSPCLPIRPTVRYSQPTLFVNSSIYLEYGDLLAPVQLDVVQTAGWQNPGTSANQLRPEFLDGVSNNTEASWCVAQVIIPGANVTPGTPGAANDCSAFVDTDTGADTQDTTPLTRFRAETVGFGQMSPGVFFTGTMVRTVGTTDFTTGTESFTCGLLYSATAVTPSPVCPGCDFAFNIDLTFIGDFGLNEVPGGPVINPPFASDCRDPNGVDYFINVGGSGTNPPNLQLGYDPVNSLLIYQVGGAWQPYTYDVEWVVGAGFLRWSKVVAESYTY